MPSATRRTCASTSTRTAASRACASSAGRDNPGTIQDQIQDQIQDLAWCMRAQNITTVERMTLQELNTIDADAAERELRRCCGSTQWAARMAAARPFRDLDDLLERADAAWRALDPGDWLEAFAAHPRIGQPTGSAWA